MRPGEQLLEALHADADRERQAHGRPEREAPADPVGEGEHVALGQPPALRLLAVGGGGDQVLRDRLVAERGDEPAARRGGVDHRLLRGEGLRGDDHQGRGGIEARHRVVEFGGVDVGDEAHLGAVAVGAQRLQREARAEGRAADAEREHVAEGHAGGALPVALAHRLGEDAHALAVALHLGEDVVALQHDVLVAAQRHVQHRAVLGGVDALAGEELLDHRGQAALARQRGEQRDRLGGDALLGEIGREAGAGKGERRAAPGILVPQLGDAPGEARVPVGKKRLPGRGGRERRHFCRPVE